MYTVLAILIVMVFGLGGALIGYIIIKSITKGVGLLDQKEKELRLRNKKLEKELQKEEDEKVDFLKGRRFRDN